MQLQSWRRSNYFQSSYTVAVFDWVFFKDILMCMYMYACATAYLYIYIYIYIDTVILRASATHMSAPGRW